jgi:stearoyl-CoA desaturase (Delta-9 desaturase)
MSLSIAWTVPVVALAVTQIAVIATSIYLHRTLAHKALRLHPAVSMGFRTILWLTTGQSRREWVAVHRKHHAFTDRDGDPHSPRLLGFWPVQLVNVYYYYREAKNPRTLTTFAPDLEPDRIERLLFSRGMLGLAIGVGMLCAAIGLWGGLIAGFLHFVLYVFVLAPSINGLGHWWGRRNFGNNSATNLRVLAWLTGGESLHNNHHAYPSSPKFSMGRFEFDPSWVVIRVLMLLRLARVVGDKVKLAA